MITRGSTRGDKRAGTHSSPRTPGLWRTGPRGAGPRRPGLAWVAGLAVGAAAFAGFTAPALAQNGAGAQPANQPANQSNNHLPFLVLDRAPLSKFLVDPRDAALSRAVEMVPDRIVELPLEVPDMGGMSVDDARLIRTLLVALGRPSRVGIVFNQTNPAGGAFGYGFVISTQFEGEADAARLGQAVQGLMDLNERAEGEAAPPAEPVPSTRFPGMMDINTPVAVVSFGPRQGARGWSYDVIVGSVDDPDAALTGVPAATLEGVDHVVNGLIDFTALTPAANFVNTMGGRDNPMVPRVINELTKVGLLGPDSVRAHFEMGYSPTNFLARVRVDNAKRLREALDLADGALTRADLDAVPADATAAFVTRADTGVLQALITRLRREGVTELDEALGHFSEVTGVDVEKDLLPALGGVAAIYTSDATGGGGFLSGVAMMTFADRARFLAAHDKLRAAARALIEEEAEEASRYIRVQAWEYEGTPMFSLRFPGLPVPLEITYAATDRWVIAGVTPQAVMAAVRQSTGKGDRGVLSRPDMQGVWREDRPLLSMQMSDTARSVRDGYPIAAMLGSAASNLARSPRDDKAREPGVVVPLYHDLIKNVRPTISTAYWSGETLVLDNVADRSMLVNIAARAGAFGSAGGLVSTALSAIGEGASRGGGDPFSLAPAGLPSALARAGAALNPFRGPLAPMAAMLRPEEIILGALGPALAEELRQRAALDTLTVPAPR